MNVVDAGWAWVSLLLRRPDRVENSEADPQGGLMPIGMDVRNWVRSRIRRHQCRDVHSARFARQDASVMDFMEDGLVADVVYSPEGAPLIDVKQVRLRDEADASG